MMSDIEAAEFVINTKPKSQSRSRLISIVSVGLAVSGVALLVSTTSSGKKVQNDVSVSALNAVDRRVTRSGGNDIERNLVSSPTKSPSAGLHKPTWKPSSKPVEHASKTVGAALPRQRELGLKPVAAQKSSSDGVNLIYYPSEPTTTTTSTTTTSTPLTSATTASNSKTAAIADSMPVGGLGPITPEGAPVGPQAPILPGTPVALAMTAPWTLYVPDAVDGSKSLSLPMSLPPSPDAPQKTELSVSEPVVTEIVEDTATTITTPDATIDTTSVALPIPKIASPNARGDPRNSPTTVTSLRTTGGSVTTKASSQTKDKDSTDKDSKKSDSSQKVLKATLKTELKTMKSELKSVKAIVEKKEDALPNASSKEEKKEIKAEIKDAKESLESKQEEIDEVKKTLSDKDALAAAVIDGEDVVKEVVTKTVYSQDADYFKKEEKRASRKAYKKAMERADAALVAKKEDASGAEVDADATVSSTSSNKKKVKTSTTVEEDEDEEEVVFKSSSVKESTTTTSKSDSTKSSSKKSSAKSSEKSSSKKSSKDDRRHLTTQHLADADPCHDGLSPRCTPPTSKPVEHRSLAGSPTKSPSSGLHKPTWKPSSKPNEHRRLAGSPTKSPSSGLHKPTWRPSSKPVEHASKSEIGAALPRQLSLKDKKEELKAFQAAALVSTEEESSSSASSSESDVDQQLFSSKFSTSSTTNKSERVSKKADAKLKAKVVEEESIKSSKGEVKQDNDKALTLQAIEVKGDIKSSELKTAAKEASKSKSAVNDEVDFELNGVTGEQKKMTKWLAEAYESSGHRQLSKADKEAANDAKHGNDKLSKKESKKIIEKKVDQLEEKKSQVKKATLSDNKAKVSSRQLENDKSTIKIAVLPKTGSDPTKSPSSGLHKPTWRPSAKPIENKKTDSVPSKSPSAGLHKPTWKPSAKPVEQSSKKSDVGAALPRQL